ncbi:hypothetical protein SAMN05216376_1203 [Mameliella alba]|nr:hypothetical protein LX94_04810 [Mameliella alba]SDE18175.1 hypothetical protein SAMN05216376_1203 [Mameliella alba]
MNKQLVQDTSGTSSRQPTNRLGRRVSCRGASLALLLALSFSANDAAALGESLYKHEFFFYAAKFICSSKAIPEPESRCSLGQGTKLIRRNTLFGFRPGKATCRNFLLIDDQESLERKNSRQMRYNDRYASDVFRTYVRTSYSFFQLRRPRHYATIAHIGNDVDLDQLVNRDTRSFQTDLLEYVKESDRQAGWEAHTATLGAKLFSPGNALVFASSTDCDGFTILNFRVNEQNTKAKADK